MDFTLDQTGVPLGHPVGISIVVTHLHFHSSVQLLFPTVILNGTSQPISIEYPSVQDSGELMKAWLKYAEYKSVSKRWPLKLLG